MIRRTSLAALAMAMLLAPAVADAGPPRQLQDQVFRARDMVMPSLVHIEPILEVFRMGERGNIAVTGSGVIFSADGYVLTNNHVVENATRVTCTLSDQREVAADLVGRDPLTDLAVLKLRGATPPGGWPHAVLGDSDALQVGEYVMAMGSPLGLSRSLSVGVVSSLNRFIPASRMPSGSPTGLYNTWIQTDAAINPGNSGGPLVSLDGKVIGINARAIPVFGENIGFAIPVSLAREVARDLIATGEVSRSWVGVRWQSTENLASFFELGDQGAQGAVVGSITHGSPADEAGLEAGDVVLEYDGEPVSVRFEEQIPALEKRIANTPVGHQVPLLVLRHGQMQQITMITQRRAKTEGSQKDHPEWGFTVREVTQEMVTSLNLPRLGGVLVTGVKPGSFAAEAGLRPGDLVLRLEDIEIEDLAHWSQAAQEAIEQGTDRLLLTVKRGPVRYFVVLKPIYTQPTARKTPSSSRKNS
ncbi:MAG: PDZ domain-containing protein [Acidobacteria bacterium]|nr:MAG: PDZ domain-containing protein [Acidobacteriota bacterium]